MSAPLHDARDREKATTLFDRNLVVTAGAGTGKTALLVERALNLIAGAGVPVDSLAAITFTEKAAAELRARLASGLDELRRLAAGRIEPATLERDTEARRAYAWLRTAAGRPAGEILGSAAAALDDLDAATISTIHAFCSEILRRFPREAGVDPSFAVDEGAAFSRLFEEIWEEFLLEDLGPRSPRGDLWREALLVPGALEAIRELGRGMAPSGVPSGALSDGAAYVPAEVQEILGRRIQEVRAAVMDVLARGSGMNERMRDFLSGSAQLLIDFLSGGADAMAAVTSPMSLDEYLKEAPRSPGKGLAGVDAGEVTRAARAAQSLIRRLATVDEKTVAPIATAAIPLAARAREALLAAGLVSFDGLLRLTRDLLAERPEIRREAASRFRTILVDEFQDTDPLQYEILFFLTEEEGAAAADAYGAKLAPGRLFIVGDPKQSIYRFRGADMEAYRRAVGHVVACGGELLTLSTSFRSPSEIVDPINRLFKEWIGPPPGEESIYEPPYERIVPARGPGGEGPRVEIWSVEARGSAEVRRRAEAEAIAAWIAQSAGKPIAYKDVAVLLRALTNAGLYAQALRRAGIPYVVEGGKDFYERPEVTDLLAFLRAAANPNDGASVLAVMRSPLGGAPDAELARFAAAGGRLDLPEGGRAETAPFPNVARTLRMLREFRAEMRGRPPDAVVRSVLEATPLPLLHASSFEGAQRIANLRKIVATAEDLARRGLGLEETLRFIEEEFEGRRAEGESPLADETVDAVRILSVHKAKGLEYPVVVVPDIGREARHQDPGGTDAAWLPRGAGGWLAVRIDRAGTNVAWAFKCEEDRLHEEAEEKRVFYVACTRARERLILVNSNDRRKAPWRDALAALGYEIQEGLPEDGDLCGGLVAHRRVAARPAGAAAPAMALDPRWAEAAARFEEVAGAAAASASAPIRWPAGARDERAAEAAVPPGSAPEEGDRPPRRPSAGRDVARLAGTAVHAALERWDFRDGAALKASARTEAARAARDDRDRGGGGPDRTAEVEAEAIRILEGFLASPLPARLARSEILAREMPVIVQDEGGATWIGSCDLVCRGGDGAIVIADYKTDLLDGEPSEAAGRYREQMEIYRRALARALPGATVRAEILFVRTGTVTPL